MSPETTYTHVNLESVEDSAAAHGFGEMGEARFATGDLEAQRTGVSFHRLRPGRRQSFGHRHEQAEEVYVVLSGSGRVKLDEEVRELVAHDALRVAPPVARCFEAGDDGMELLAVGARHEGDGEILPGWWS
ncbi:cupin domain-containing protein [Conexibacter stalactiti]|uniref:Cupin domain-containing protein n=1 Tax=Conexibacter stalactiti TaxID=1940611 RepID=A0ABU4HK35_9ACTN|nr:cupin domain-containing protein [Conexibacter stalactiti]MDW5593676.1 cupin domain-containing protein [Conexibacter stalactiti]MEC5034317.1 cupin domain-containing protein [Conexibacter stalactiti]